VLFRPEDAPGTRLSQPPINGMQASSVDPTAPAVPSAHTPLPSSASCPSSSRAAAEGEDSPHQNTGGADSSEEASLGAPADPERQRRLKEMVLISFEYMLRAYTIHVYK
jgi:hypothetical protein